MVRSSLGYHFLTVRCQLRFEAMTLAFSKQYCYHRATRSRTLFRIWTWAKQLIIPSRIEARTDHTPLTMGQIEWAMWANEQAIASASLMILGGVVGVAGQFRNSWFGIYALVAGVFIFFLEYPRSKRKKGNTIERAYQNLLTPVIAVCGPVTRNYWVRFVLHLVLSVPCCFILPTVLGGICLIITSIIYFVAALKGEQWIPLLPDKKSEGATVDVSLPPEQPPPRRPVQEDTSI